MQSAYCFFETSNLNQKVNSQKRFRLTSRDLDILEFILEMKFSTIEDIHFKFFKVTRFGLESNSLTWSKQRIQKLIKCEFLQFLTSICAKPLLVITQKGYLYLRNSRVDKNYCRPMYEVDGRTYDHDQRVIKNRLAMESKGISKDWISERQLSEVEEVKKLLPTEFRPDGLYLDSQGQKVAFELEISRKSKERYQQKIKRYIQVIMESQGSQKIFDSVHYVCEKHNILELLKSEAAIFQTLFRFSLESEILSEAGGL